MQLVPQGEDNLGLKKAKFKQQQNKLEELFAKPSKTFSFWLAVITLIASFNITWDVVFGRL